MLEDAKVMQRAVELALLAEEEGNLPVGAVMTLGGEIIAEGRSAIWQPKFDATRHAEMEALRAVPQGHWRRSSEMVLYTTLEPCLMCFGAILLHGIGRVVFGSEDSFGGSGVTLSCLPPFFDVQFEGIQWVGPTNPVECDPLHARLLTIEAARKR
jgi:tRNA(adenine34) deaminase